MNKRLLICLLIVCVVSVQAWAQTDKPERVSVPRYSVAFTVESNCLVTYPENGDGFSCIHNSQGGGKGTKADYGLLCFGSPFYNFTDKEIAAIKMDLGGDKMLEVSEVKTNTRFAEVMKAAMGTHSWKPAGEATIKVEGGPSLKMPYFSWSTQKAGKTHHALMYVVMHGDAFITVQVESSKPFSKPQVEWFTTKLELTKISPPK
jgi:hypothetical protein